MGRGAATALPFTGFDLPAMVGVAAIALGLGLGLTVVGSTRRRDAV